MWEGFRHGVRAGDSLRHRPIGSSGSPFGDPAVGDRHHRCRGITMTVRHQTWLADALAGSVLMFALYLILLEFSEARLP